MVSKESGTPLTGSAELEKVDEALIMRALKSNTFSQEDIDKLNKAIKELVKPVPIIRIALYEMCGDFIAAFKLHFSNA